MLTPEYMAKVKRQGERRELVANLLGLPIILAAMPFIIVLSLVDVIIDEAIRKPLRRLKGPERYDPYETQKSRQEGP